MDSTRGIDFGRLTLKDALDLAILVEEEAKERYEEFVEQMETHRTPDAARFFRFMAANEEKHRGELAARRTQLFKGAPSVVTRAMLFDIEAPEYDEARVFMSVRAALEAALRSERKAHAFFVQVLPRVTDPDVRALFKELCEEELAHGAMVERELAKLPPDSGFKAEDFADDPVAQ
ncbi:MAG: ferritin family protein [Planctomycetes bacterium]|nr:ferritin family protein [Planctomycetota bacterium]